jgi:hypothetical protein
MPTKDLPRLEPNLVVSSCAIDDDSRTERPDSEQSLDVICPTTETQMFVRLSSSSGDGNRFICPACSRLHAFQISDRTITDFGPSPRCKPPPSS